MPKFNRCGVPGCNKDTEKDPNVNFHRIPDTELGRVWIKFLLRLGGTVYKKSRICSSHFTPEQFHNGIQVDLGFGNRRKLTDTAVPSLPPPPPLTPATAGQREQILTETHFKEEERPAVKMEKSSSASEQPRRSPVEDELDGFPVLRAVEEDWDSSSSSKTQHSDDPDENENEKAQQSRTKEGTSRNEPSASSQDSGGNSREETMCSPLTKIKDEPIDEGYDKALIPQSDISRVKEELENGDQESVPPPDELRISSVFSVRGAAEAMSAPVAASQPSPFPTISQVTSAIKAPLMVLPTQPQTHLQAKPLTQIQLQLPPQIQNQLHIQPQPPPPPQLQPPAASIRICCSGCSKVLQKGQTAFQRKGSNQLFCSTVCLTGFTLPPAISIAPKKTCHLCLKVIGNPKDLITVPVDSMNTLKEFCSQACLTIYKSRVEGLNEDNIIRCSMCRKPSEIQHEVNHQGVLHKLCSDECFSRFRSSKRLSMSCCEICGNCNVTGNYHLVQVEDAVKKFCSPVCISTFKQKSGKRVHCPGCQEFKGVDQMLEGTNAQGVIEFFCSSRCVTNSQASRTLSGASFPCTNCQKLAIPQYHLAMPDGSIRNFCTYDCVGKFQERLQKPSPQVNGSSTVTANASGVAPRGPQHPSAAPRPSAPPQITNPTSNQTTIPPHVPAPGLAAPQGSQQHQQQPGAAAASSPGPARLTCKQCQKPISSKPEVLQYKNHVGLFCSRLCCDSYKREKDVKATCEYCKEEKILKDITMYEHKLRPFCCEGCKLLFKHELSKQHGAQCRVCAYCSNMTHNTIQNHFGGKLEEFCTEECMSLYTVLFYEMAKCYGCKTQGTLSESLKWDGTIKHFCNLHCVLQFCCKSIIPDQPISNGTTAATAAQAPLSLSKDMPVIGGVVSLASALAGNTALTGALPTSNASSKVIGDASTQTDAAVNAGPHQRRMLKNKALMCKPIIEEQAIQCNLDPPKSLFETVIDENGEKVKLVPVPVPIPMPVYIPVPMHLYSQFTPVPVGLPLPVPVPMVIPPPSASTQHSVTKSSVPSQSSVEDEDTEKSKDRPVSHGDQGSTYSGDLESEARSTPFSWADTEDSSHNLKPVSLPVSQLTRPTSEPPASTSPDQLDLEQDFPIESYNCDSEKVQRSPSKRRKRVKRVDTVEESLNEDLDSDSDCSELHSNTRLKPLTVDNRKFAEVEYILSDDEQVEVHSISGSPYPSQLSSWLPSTTTVETRKAVGSRNLRTKQQFCVYCKKPNSKLARHLESQHANKPAVARALRFPKGSKKRRFFLEELCKEGNYQHNIDVLQNGNGEIVPKKRAKEIKSVIEYLPCQYCLTFFLRSALLKHERSCRIKRTFLSSSNALQELDTEGHQSSLETSVQLTQTTSRPILAIYTVQISQSSPEHMKPASLVSCDESDLTPSPQPSQPSGESYIPTNFDLEQPLSPESCHQLSPDQSLQPDLEDYSQTTDGSSLSPQSPYPSPDYCRQTSIKTILDSVPQSNQEHFETAARSDLDLRTLPNADLSHQSSVSSNPEPNPQSGFETLLQFVESCTSEIDSYSKSCQKTNYSDPIPKTDHPSVDSCLPPSVRSSPELNPQPSPYPTSQPSRDLSFEDDLPASPESFHQDSDALSPQPAVKCNGGSSPQFSPKSSVTTDQYSQNAGFSSTYSLRSKLKPVPKVLSIDKRGKSEHGMDPDILVRSKCNQIDDEQDSLSINSDEDLDTMGQSVEDIGVGSSLRSSSCQKPSFQSKKSSTAEIATQTGSPSSPEASCNTSSNSSQSNCGQKLSKQKRQFCFYCKKSFSKIARHLLMRHKNEPQVAQALSIPKGSKERLLLLGQLRNKGNYQHNIDVIREGNGEIVPKSRRRINKPMVDYFPCQYCLAFFLGNALLRHERTCKLKNSQPSLNVLQNLDTESRNQSSQETCAQPTSESSQQDYCKSRLQLHLETSSQRSHESGPQCSRESSPQRSRESGPQRSRESNPLPNPKSSPQRSRESSPQHSRESGPQRSRESSPQRSRESSPQRSRESSPQRSRESSPQRSRESSPQRSRESSPQRSRESSPQRSRESSPQRSRESSPQASRESSPQASRESSPQRSRESSPQRSRESSPLPNPKSSPQASRESSPQASRESSPQRSRESSPQRSHESSPQRSHESSPLPDPESSLQRSRLSSPQASRETSPQRSRESSPQASRESSPQRSRESSPLPHHEALSPRGPLTPDSCNELIFNSISEASPQIDFDSCLKFLEECSSEAVSYSDPFQKSSVRISPEVSPQNTEQDPELPPESGSSLTSQPSIDSHLQGTEQSCSEDDLPASPESCPQDSVELSPEPSPKCNMESTPNTSTKPQTELCKPPSLSGDCVEPASSRSCSTYNLRRKSTQVPKVSPYTEKLELDSDVSDESEYMPADDDQSCCNMDSDDSLDEDQPAKNLDDSSAIGSSSCQNPNFQSPSNQDSSSALDMSSNPVPSHGLTVTKSYKTVGGQKISKEKRNFCVYCMKSYCKISRHLLYSHANETDVVQARSFRKGSKQRRLALQQLRIKGNYQHNIKVIQTGSGEIITKKRPPLDYSASEYLPCRHCLDFFVRQDLWRHQKFCQMKKDKGKGYRRRIQSKSSKLVPLQGYLPGACETIISGMYEDDVLDHIKKDALICKYGDCLFVRHGHDKKSHLYVSQKMRELGRFMLAVKEIDQSVEHLKQVLTPSRFNLAVKGAKIVAGFDESSNKSKTPSLALKLAYSIRQIAEILIGDGLMANDTESVADLEEFVDLLETNWICCVKNCDMQNPESTGLESCIQGPTAASPTCPEVVNKESVVMPEAETTPQCSPGTDLLLDMAAEPRSESTPQPTQNCTTGLLKSSLSNDPNEKGTENEDEKECELSKDAANHLEKEDISHNPQADEPATSATNAPSALRRKSTRIVEVNSKFSSFSGIKATPRLRVSSSKSKESSSEPRVIRTRKAPGLKKNFCKRYFCVYCKKPTGKISRHLARKHRKEKDVAHAFSFPKGSKMRRVLLRQLSNKGTYEHNVQVLQSGTGEIVPQRKLKKDSLQNDFESCPHCLGFFQKQLLLRHKTKCHMKKQEDQHVLSRRRLSSVKTYALNDCLSEGCRDIVERMHNDEISKQVNDDSLICKLGNRLFEKIGHQKHQSNYISQKMRELGRFMLAVKELDASVEYAHQVCTEARYELALEAAKKLGSFDQETNKLKYSVIMLKLGYSLRQVTEIALEENTMDDEATAQAKGFIDRLEKDWFSYVSSHTCASESSIKRNPLDVSILTKDVMKLQDCVRLAEEQAKQELIENPSLDAWKKLCRSLLAMVGLFNRGQKSMTDKILLKKFMERTKEHGGKNCEMFTKLEQSLLDKLIRIESAWEEESAVPTLITERMESSMEVLIKYRENVGIPADNPYVFARVDSTLNLGATKCLRDFAQNCGAEKPDCLTTTRVRIRVGTIFQILSLNDSEMHHVAKLVGDKRYNWQQLKENPLQLSKLCNFLYAIERGVVPRNINPPDPSKGTASAGFPAKLAAVGGETPKKGPAAPAVKRKGWSLEEQRAVKKHMGKYISLQKVPGKDDCSLCLSAEPDALKSRTWRDIKNYVHNTIQSNKRRRRNPQQMEEEQADSDSDEEEDDDDDENDSVDDSDDEPPPKRRNLSRGPRRSGSDGSSTISKIHHVYGVKAWASWVQSRSQRSDVSLKEDVLQCSAVELSEGLCRFVTEVRRPNGQVYAPDSVYYLCLGIQQYLLENNRLENIFLDPQYGRFASDITRLLKDQENTLLPSGFLQSRVEESFLWDSKQLGALSPFVLLNTLLFFCVKLLNLKTLIQHERLSFSNFTCCTRTTDQGTTSYLRVKLERSEEDEHRGEPVVLGKRKREEEEEQEYMEMPADTEHPLRCPVQLYLFYLSRCSDSVKQRSGMFYLQPEASCDPSSPVWFSEEPLERTVLDSMLTRILAVRDVYHQDPRRQLYNSSDEESS
ncbi:uncharacterized protein si:ch211-266o15.1 isoform X3 [Astyanax mexicanus]|uniref:uncharacterized protein si:ch211-266o15.1 isoform X3 n=1 Tax=Astyanax mexicanus TaxID=7994 RepID=UPI0020CB68EF|nr:uncharacterized protein si:ch211-266o15.1 isoform X3 [Astyanax mexicanus]